MTVYFFAEMNAHDPKGYAEYPPKVLPLVEKHGGRITHRIGDFEIFWHDTITTQAAADFRIVGFYRCADGNDG